MKIRTCSAIFVIGITLLKGVVECSPSLTGLTSICPGNNDTLVLTCRGKQVPFLVWNPEEERILLHSNEDIGQELSIGNFTGKLTEVSNWTNATQVADIASTLTMMTSALRNGTNITCATNVPMESTSITLIFAEKITLNATVVKAGSAMFDGTRHNLTQFLATLFKETAIDFYNISFSGAVGTYFIVNTPSDLTWQHNVTSFNVTAHNCIGQSDSVTVYISHESSRHDNEIDTEIKTGEIIVPVVTGTAGVLFITSVVVTSIFVFVYVQRAKRKCPRSSNTTHILQNIRPTSGDDNTPDIQPRNSSLAPAYSYVQVPMVTMKPPAQQGSYASVYRGNQPTSSQNVNVIGGMYSEIGDINGPLSQAIPPPPANDTVTHFHPDLLQCHDTPVPLPTQPPPTEGSEPDVNEPVKDLDVHPLDKTINGHMILLQLGSVRPHWRTFGSAAGVDEETLDMINADLTEDSEKLAEVVFRWMEQKTFVTWAEIAHLCKLIGFHELSEALNKAYKSGILPVEDDTEVSIPIREETEAPPLPPRDDLECDEAGGSPPPPLPPPLSSENLPPYPDNRYPGPPPRPKPYIPSTQ